MTTDNEKEARLCGDEISLDVREHSKADGLAVATLRVGDYLAEWTAKVSLPDQRLAMRSLEDSHMRPSLIDVLGLDWNITPSKHGIRIDASSSMGLGFAFSLKTSLAEYSTFVHAIASFASAAESSRNEFIRRTESVLGANHGFDLIWVEENGPLPPIDGAFAACLECETGWMYLLQELRFSAVEARAFEPAFAAHDLWFIVVGDEKSRPTLDRLEFRLRR